MRSGVSGCNELTGSQGTLTKMSALAALDSARFHPLFLNVLDGMMSCVIFL